MILGKREHFARAHYEAHAGVAPPHLAELVVHCLELVAQLGRAGLEFRFKGGNSQLILLEDPQRFSIDVDIVTVAPKEQLTRIVDDVVRDCDVFLRAEARAPKTKPWLPLISFKLFFASEYQPPEESFVMLDAVLEPAPYAGVRRPVRCAPLYESDVEVEVPTIAGLIGDKLLAIGPSTLGIPLGKGKEAQRLKHVFDVATLSRRAHDVALVRASIAGCKQQEEAIQGRAFPYAAVAEDTRTFCATPLGDAAPPALSALAEGTYYFEIVKGFEQFRQHLFRVDYTWDMFRGDCRRVLEVLDAIGTV